MRGKLLSGRPRRQGDPVEVSRDPPCAAASLLRQPATMWAGTRRVLKLFGESGAWKVISAVHTALYRLTRGRIGHHAAGMANLLLTTTGRRSGTPRTVALTYIPDGTDYIVVASNGGTDRHPGWWLNLEHTPQASVQVGRNIVSIVAHAADHVERGRLWPKLTAANAFYARYEQLTARPIPVVVLRPRIRA